MNVHTKAPLPPYGRQYTEHPPSSGLWVAIGPGAWDIASSKPFPVVVLPIGRHPSEYEWPGTDAPALIYETGPQDDQLLHNVAKAILLAGAPSVVAVRESLLRKRDACVYFEAVSA